jgi:catechol 2,3-dioxygenase-like lactoylglutathione lyase family enzyme
MYFVRNSPRLFRGVRCEDHIRRVALNVDDVPASSAFLTEHFGFREEMAADGFASLARDDSGMQVIFLRRGLETLPADQRDDRAQGLILAFDVEDLEASSRGSRPRALRSPCL